MEMIAAGLKKAVTSEEIMSLELSSKKANENKELYEKGLMDIKRKFDVYLGRNDNDSAKA